MRNTGCVIIDMTNTESQGHKKIIILARMDRKE